jgi:hypothetical protein
MKKIIVIAVIVAGIGIAVLGSQAQGPTEQPKKNNDLIAQQMSELMKLKLEHAQKILAGVSRNDFESIASHADDLIALTNRAEWMASKTPAYELYSNSFRRSAGDLIRGARAKNSDAVALAYVDLTMSCVKCHRYVREVRDVRLDPKAPADLPALARNSR